MTRYVPNIHENDSNNPVTKIKELSERLMKYFPDSKFVKPKEKCKIGGKEVCNRGDIGNWVISEEIKAEEAHKRDDAIKTLLDGKRDVATTSYLTHDEKILLGNNNIGVLLVKHPKQGYHHILYRDKQKALRLKDIIEDNKGFLNSENPETVREIGKILGYTDESINDFISKKFGEEAINEVLAGKYVDHEGERFDIYLNPPSIRKFDFGSRGICLPNGDIYIIDDAHNVIHNDLINYLRRRGVNIDRTVGSNYNQSSFIAVAKKTGNDLYLGESYHDNVIKERRDYFINVFKKCKQKNPNINFHIQQIFEMGKEHVIIENDAISYSAVVLDEYSREKLIEYLSLDKLNEDWEIIADHMTISLNDLPDHQKRFRGRTIRLKVTKFGHNDQVLAAGVDTKIPTKNEQPHITLAVNRSSGGKPVMSNEIKNWKPIKPFIVSGKVREVPEEK
ncbi:MAG: hypothetical protein ACOCVF_00380 [bacterium]